MVVRRGEIWWAKLPKPVGSGSGFRRPVLIVHGRSDPMIDLGRAVESRDRLIALGLAVRYREYEMGHEIAPDALRELVGWLEERLSSPIQLV